MLREQLKEQASKPEQQNTTNEAKGFDPGLRQLHEGWLQHPVSIHQLEKLNKELALMELAMKSMCLQPSATDSYIRGMVFSWITLKDNIRILTQLS